MRRNPPANKTDKDRPLASTKLGQLAKWSANLNLIRRIIFDLLYIALPLLLIGTFLKEFNREEIILDPIVIPDDLKTKFSGAYLAEKLIDETKKIDNEFRKFSENKYRDSNSKISRMAMNSEEYSYDIKVPGSENTFKSIVRYYKNLFKYRLIHVRGQITTTPKRTTLTLRNISQPEIPNVEFSLDDGKELDKIYSQGGEAVLKLTDSHAWLNWRYQKFSQSKEVNFDSQESLNKLLEQVLDCKNLVDSDVRQIDCFYFEGKALNDIGFSLIENNKKEEARQYLQIAIEKFQNVIEFDPRYKMAYYSWAIALYDLGDKQGAIRKYQKVLQLDPNDADVYNNWGVILNEQGEYQSAIEKFKKAITLKPNYASAISGWGHALKALGDNKNADEKFLEAGRIELSDFNFKPPFKPTDITNITQLVNTSNAVVGQAHIGMGDAYLKRGDTKQAIDAYKTSIEYAPQYPLAYKKLGELLKKLGRNEEGEEFLRKAQKVERENQNLE